MVHTADAHDEHHRLLTIPEAAKLLGVHPNTVKSAIKRGAVKATRAFTGQGEAWLIDEHDLAGLPARGNGHGQQSQHVHRTTATETPSRSAPLDERQLTELREQLLAPLVRLVEAQQETIREQAEEIGRLRARLARSGSTRRA